MTESILSSNTPDVRNALTGKQILLSAVLGAILWFAAAVALGLLGPMGVYEGTSALVLYALIVPGTIPFVFLVRKLAGLAANQVALGYSVATAMALLLDGIAVLWFPGLYGAELELVVGAAATILWGAGVGLVLAFVINKAD